MGHQSTTPRNPHEEKSQRSEEEDGDLHEDDLKHIWPEAESELERLKIAVPLCEDKKELDVELDLESEAAFAALDAAVKKRRKTSDSTKSSSSSAAPNLRAVRTRYGRIRKEITRLSYNHHDKSSVAMLHYSNK